jgi:type IV pilus assembly protein PilV
MINDRDGFTLVEFLVAIVILMVGLLGLLQTINVAVDQNLGNVFRNEAVIVVDEMMMKKRAKAFDSLSTGTKFYIYSTQVRGIPKKFNMTERVDSVTSNSKQLTIEASWTKKNSTYNHSATTVVSTY